jgi:inosose dehydratase
MNDDAPELGASISLERCLAEARAAGFEGIELGRKFPREERVLRPLLKRHALALVSGWYSARLAERGAEREFASLRDHLALLRAMKCTALVFGDVTRAVHRTPKPLSARPKLTARSWPRFLRELEVLARRIRDEGIQMAYHHHMGTFIETPDEIARLMDGTSPAVGLLLDTGHLAWGARGDVEALPRILRGYADRIVHVHLKDVRREVLERALAADMPFLTAVRAGVFTVPGDGDFDLAPVIETLALRRYDGWIVVEAEQDPARADPLTYANLGYAHTQALVERHALARAAAGATPRRML